MLNVGWSTKQDTHSCGFESAAGSIFDKDCSIVLRSIDCNSRALRAVTNQQELGKRDIVDAKRWLWHKAWGPHMMPLKCFSEIFDFVIGDFVMEMAEVLCREKQE